MYKAKMILLSLLLNNQPQIKWIFKKENLKKERNLKKYENFVTKLQIIYQINLNKITSIKNTQNNETCDV